MASAAQQLSLVCWLASGAHLQRRGGKGAGRRLQALSLAAACLALLAPLLSVRSRAGVAAALAAAAGGCAALHSVMASLPRTFTLGEGMLVSQVRRGVGSGSSSSLVGHLPT